MSPPSQSQSEHSDWTDPESKCVKASDELDHTDNTEQADEGRCSSRDDVHLCAPTLAPNSGTEVLSSGKGTGPQRHVPGAVSYLVVGEGLRRTGPGGLPGFAPGPSADLLSRVALGVTLRGGTCRRPGPDPLCRSRPSLPECLKGTVLSLRLKAISSVKPDLHSVPEKFTLLM